MWLSSKTINVIKWMPTWFYYHPLILKKWINKYITNTQLFLEYRLVWYFSSEHFGKGSVCIIALHSMARMEGLLPGLGKVLTLTWPSRTWGKAQKLNEQHQAQNNINFNSCIKWFEENYITSSPASFKKCVLLYLWKLQTPLTKNIYFFLLTEDRINIFFSSKSSGLSLLWNGK